jgi:hypothetical protein
LTECTKIKYSETLGIPRSEAKPSLFCSSYKSTLSPETHLHSSAQAAATSSPETH